MQEDLEKDKSMKIEEPLEVYFKSSKFLNSFKRLTISTLGEQEEANREFFASLTPLQRLEYLHFLNQAVFSDKIKTLPIRFTTLSFD